MNSNFSTPIIVRAMLWVFVLMVEVIIPYFTVNWYQKIGFDATNIISTVLILAATFRFGESNLMAGFRDLCLYDIIVQCFGWYSYQAGYSMEYYNTFTYSVLVLKFIRLLWPLQNNSGSELVDWPVFGIFSLMYARKEQEKNNASHQQDMLAYMAIIFTIPLMGILRAMDMKTPLAFWAAIGVTIILVYVKPFLSYLEKRDRQYIANEKKAAALEATEAKNIELAQANANIQRLLQEREQDKVLLEKYNSSLRDAAHDLQEPMHVVRAYASHLILLDKQALFDIHKRAEVGQKLEDAIAQMTDFIDATIHSAQVVTGIVKPTVSVIDMNALVKRFQGEWLDGPMQMGLDRFDIYPRRHALLYCAFDLLILKRILRNLLANALQHSRQGTGILLAIRKRGKHCEISIWDKGYGIAEGAGKDGAVNFAAFAERIRREGSQVKEAGKRSGYRLGMNNVLQLCLATGITMHLHSKLGKGSVFGFMIPLADATQFAEIERSIQADQKEIEEISALLKARGDLPMPKGDFLPKQHHLERLAQANQAKSAIISEKGLSETPGK